MFAKPVVLGVLLAASPLCFLAAVQDPNLRQGAASLSEEIAALRGEVARLRAVAEDARARLEGAQSEVGEVRRQLEECLDLLQQSTEPERRHNCTPSRASLTYYQWLDRNGHGPRADAMLERAIAENGNEPRRLVSMASSLMREEETAGKFDRAALAVARRLLVDDAKLDPRALDVIAMAHFLNGQVDEAVQFERRAVGANKNGEDRERLRLYEAALRSTAQRSDAAVSLAAGGE